MPATKNPQSQAPEPDQERYRPLGEDAIEAIVSTEDGLKMTGVYRQGADGVIRLVSLTLESEDGLSSTDPARYPWRQERASAEWWLSSFSGPGTSATMVTTRPDGSSEWWRTFAAMYQEHRAADYSAEEIAQMVSRRIGDTIGVPTLKRWTVEARRQGYLPPTTRTRKDTNR